MTATIAAVAYPCDADSIADRATKLADVAVWLVSDDASVIDLPGVLRDACDQALPPRYRTERDGWLSGAQNQVFDDDLLMAAANRRWLILACYDHEELTRITGMDWRSEGDVESAREIAADNDRDLLDECVRVVNDWDMRRVGGVR